MEKQHNDFDDYIKGLDEQIKEPTPVTIDDIKVLAENGSPDAQNELAIAYMTGEGIAKNTEKAVCFFKKAADKHHIHACVNLAFCYIDGVGTNKDVSQAIHFLAIALRQAHPGELNPNLLELFFSEKIDIVALSEIAEQGNAQAQYFLGMCYADGTQVTQDRAKAWELYVKSAEQGEALALCIIGVYVAEGTGVMRDLFHAEEILTHATASGSNMAGVYKRVIRERIINEVPYLLVKITDKKWAKSLLDGNIFMRSLADFADFTKRKADTNNTFRGDVLEGISESFISGYNPYGYATYKGKILKDGTVGVVDALTFRRKVFCLYSLEYNVTKKCYMKPDEQLRSFGDTAVVITDVAEFLRRVNLVLTERYGDSFWWSCRRVHYNVDLNADFTYNEFNKSHSYTWQNEFRIALDLSEGKFHPEILKEVTDYAKIRFIGKIEEDTHDDSISNALSLSIGDIRDICVEMPVSELLELENTAFETMPILPKDIKKYEHEHKPYSTFLKRIIQLSNGSLAFSKNWLDSKNHPKAQAQSTNIPEGTTYYKLEPIKVAEDTVN